MRTDKPQDSPVLTPEQVLQLRGVDLDNDGLRFDVAVICFRGQRASRQVLDAFPATRIEPDILYGSPAHAGRVGDQRIIILPKVVWGGPVTAILLEELACLGVQTAIGLGAAGSLVSPHHVGQMLIADRALCSDGTSQQYTDQPTVGPAPELFELAMALASQEGEEPIVGTIHTTDALYQEWPARVQQWREAGAAFVNLETSPFYAVAAYVGIRAVYLGLVTDYVGDPGRWQHTFWGRPSTTDPSIVKIIQQLVQADDTRPR
jgi:uridine phosphorylase